ncbi:thymidine kinase, partial [Enterococcus faecalis]
EAQFLKTEQVHQLSRIVDTYNVPVMAYGLRTDFAGKLFEGSKELLAIADKLIELKAVCHCGKKAIMTARLMEDGTPVKEGNQICIGDEIYVSLCRKHWNELTKKLG